MEIKILNSILFKELMPWTFDAKAQKPSTKNKKVGSKEPTTEAELVQQLQILLADYSDLSKWLTKQNTKGTSTLKTIATQLIFQLTAMQLASFIMQLSALKHFVFTMLLIPRCRSTAEGGYSVPLLH
jgi:hypothetical protein